MEKGQQPQSTARPAVPSASSAGQRFWQGAAASARGWRLIASHRALWPYVILPVAINLVLTLLLLALLLALAVWLMVHVHPWFHEGWSPWWSWLGVLAEIGAALLVLFCALAGAAIAWLLLSGLLCGFFYARLARQAELLLGARPDELRELSVWQETVDTLRTVTRLIFYSLAWFALGLLPVLGPPLALVGSAYTAWFLLGSEYLGYPLALRAMPLRDRKAFARRHRLQTLGLGATVFGAQFLPIVGAVLLAGAVAGAVLLRRQLIAGERASVDEQNRPTG